MITREDVKTLVARELGLIEDATRREALRSLLVEPRVEVRSWDYGAPGQSYAYWVVAEAPTRNIILAYCENGFGPEFPWGVLDVNNPQFMSLGNDAQWNWYLEEAFVRAGLWTGPVKPGLQEAFHLSPEERFGDSGRDA
jgi:hypothetical protein